MHNVKKAKKNGRCPRLPRKSVNSLLRKAYNKVFCLQLKISSHGMCEDIFAYDVIILLRGRD